MRYLPEEQRARHKTDEDKERKAALIAQRLRYTNYEKRPRRRRR